MTRTFTAIALAGLLSVTLIIVNSCVTATDPPAHQEPVEAAPEGNKPAERSEPDTPEPATGTAPDVTEEEKKEVAAVEPSPEMQSQSEAPDSAEVLPVRVIAGGQQSAVRYPVARSVTSSAVWEDTWYAIHANQIEPPEAPEVDFTQETVIVLIMGERTSGGYGVRAERVVSTEETITVEVAVTEPPPDAVVSMALTSPFQLLAVPVVDRSVVFIGDSLEEGYSPYD